MSKKRKIFLRILYYFFLAITLLILGAVCLGIIFYASGYQVNWKAKKIEKTGMLVINSQESGLKIFIDKTQIDANQGRSAMIFSSGYTASLLPGEYDLEIQKDGRLPYDEHIVINDELITKIENVLLLPAEIPDQPVLSAEMTSYSFSPDNKEMIYQTSDNKVLTYNFDTKHENMLDEKTFSDKITSYQWDPNGNRALLKIDEKSGPFYYLLDLNSIDNSYFLQDKMSFLPFFDEIYFSPFNPNEFFGINKTDLYTIDIDSSKTNKIAENVGHFIQRKNYFYYSDQNDSLIQLDPRSLKENVILEKFALGDDFDLLPMNSESDIYLKSNGSLYYIEDENNLRLIDSNVSTILAESNDYQIIYDKGFEIWIYDTNKDDDEILTRFGKPISNIQEFYNDKYLLYQQNQDLDVIKKDGQNSQEIHNNATNVKVLDKNKIVIIEADGNKTIFKLIDLSTD